MFAEQFAFQLPASVDFVGGGGKTALILRLMREASVATIYTTTTRIHPPRPTDGMMLLCGSRFDRLQELVNCLGRRSDNRIRQLVVAGPEIRASLLQGVPPDFGAGIDQTFFPLLLNEADGARSMSIKMPREGEPVLMRDSNYLVPVIGLDCLGKQLGPETLFRWEMASSRYALEPGRIITPGLAASLLLHPQGVCRDWHPGRRIIPYINKADSEGADSAALELADALLHSHSFPVEKVVWGSLLRDRAGLRTRLTQ